MPSSSLTITVPPRTTPVVTVPCACAATGAAIALATAMASILFRMVNSLAKNSAGKPAQIAIQCVAGGIVP
jgi:hypothetical protein